MKGPVELPAQNGHGKFYKIGRVERDGFMCRAPIFLSECTIPIAEEHYQRGRNLPIMTLHCLLSRPQSSHHKAASCKTE